MIMKKRSKPNQIEMVVGHYSAAHALHEGFSAILGFPGYDARVSSSRVMATILRGNMRRFSLLFRVFGIYSGELGVY